MNILIVAHFSSTHGKGNSRFDYLANMLGNENKVELITSSFSHSYKKQRNLEKEELEGINYKLTTVYEPGYKKNVSIKRFYSHYKMSKNLQKYLYNLDYKPDVIYCSIPSLDVAKVTAKFAKKNNIRFIIDVQDLWPEAFKMVLNIPVISDLIFYPMKKTADYIYEQADDIVAVSETYLERARKVNNKYKNNLSVFLGTELEYFDKCKQEYKTKNNEKYLKLAYIGTLGHSYDIKCIIDALKILNNKANNDIKFIIMGSGPLKEEFEKYAIENNVNCEFTGKLSYEEMVGTLCDCDIAINPIKAKSAGSIINKVGDYAAAGLPVINTQECIEYRNLVEEYNIGFNCENGNPQDVAEKIEILYKDKTMREEFGKNNRKLAEEKFDRKKTYKQIANLIINS